MQKIRIKNFSKSLISVSPSNLLNIQKESWKQFWEHDLKSLFLEIFPIYDYSGEKVEFQFLDYKLGEAKYKTDLEAKENNDSYEAPFKINVSIKNLKTQERKEQEIFFGNFPLMTEKGTFIINGVERVIISQLSRSPGAFFSSKTIRGKNCFAAKIIPYRGSWLEFETEPDGFIGVKIDKKRKAPFTTFLKALGLFSDQEWDKKIIKLFEDVDRGEIKYLKQTLSHDFARNREEAIIEIYRRLRPNEWAAPELAYNLIKNTFFNFERYDLSEVGRWRMAQRLPELTIKTEKITYEDRVLKINDIIAVAREIIRLNNNPAAKPDEIDHLGNQRVKTVAEVLRNRIWIGLKKMERNIKDKISIIDIDILPSPSQFINPQFFTFQIKEFFTNSQIAQFMAQENPLAELEHKRRLTSIGTGGLTRERAGFSARDVQPSCYGKICPIQTPEGANVGLVTYLASFARINPYGFLEAPYFKVKQGKVTSKIQYLDAYKEEQYNLVSSGGILIDKKNNIISKKVEARIKGEPGLIDRKKIDFIDISPQQSISISTSCIPFLQNDDANRAAIGSNIQRQAIPLLLPEAPLVCTGVEKIIARESGEEIIAENNGKVEEVDANHIKIKYYHSGNKSKTYDKIYKIKTFNKSNQYTCFGQRPIFKKNQKIKKGDILVDGTAMDRGYLALGQNVLVAFMSWRGGNFNDAIIISERLVKNDYFTSLHIESFSCDVRETKLEPEVTTRDIPNVSEEKLKDLDDEGIIRIGAEVKPKDILVGKVSPKGEVRLTSEERLLRAIFGEKAKEVKDSSLTLPHGRQGRVIKIKVFSREQGDRLESGVLKRIQVEVGQIRKIMIGDKVCDRHGNKGVIAKILPEEEMPFLKDGTPIDIILNPLSIVSRMNLGQILETALGWAAKKLGYIAISPSLSGATEKDIKKELKKAGLGQDGKVVLYDGRTGAPFSQKITVGYTYIMKLDHMVEDKIHMRSIGPYSLITQQPLKGKGRSGGQRFGEMEVWALEGYGAAHTLQEMLTIKSDDIFGRAKAYEAILRGEEIKNPNIPVSFNLLINELKGLGLNIEIKKGSSDKT